MGDYGVMDFIMEFILTAWMELAMKLVPERKMTEKKKMLFKCLAVALILYVVIAFTAGSIMLSDQVGPQVLAVCLISSSVAIFLLQIVLGSIFCRKKR